MTLDDGEPVQTETDGSGDVALKEFLPAALKAQTRDGTNARAKYAQLCEALIAAVNAGVVRPGDQLPPEPDLAALTGLSLGTVRRSLTRLASEGVVSREHGRGTFIANFSRQLSDFLHMRFMSGEAGSRVLKVYTRVLAHELIGRQGDWGRVLGRSRSGYVWIRRASSIGGRFLCASDLYLSADRFRQLIDQPTADMERIGLRQLLLERFDAPTVRMRKTIRLMMADDEIAGVLEIAPGEPVMRTTVTGFTYGDRPITFLRLYVPPNDCEMDVSALPKDIRA